MPFTLVYPMLERLTIYFNLTEPFVTAGEVAQDLGVSKPFAYKLVRQMNEELEEKGFITIAGRVSRKYYEEKFYGMAQAN